MIRGAGWWKAHEHAVQSCLTKAVNNKITSLPFKILLEYCSNNTEYKMWGNYFRGQRAFDIIPTDTLREFLDKAYISSEGKGEDGDFICILDLEIFKNSEELEEKEHEEEGAPGNCSSEVSILQPSIDIISSISPLFLSLGNDSTLEEK